MRCGIEFVLRSQIESVLVLNPVTLEREEIRLHLFHHYRDYVLGRGNHPSQRRDAD